MDCTALPSARRRSRRGFTLVELYLALFAGLLVASAAFLLARNAARFFNGEARIAVAQFSSVMGLGRLQADLQRASFLSTPNIRRDPLRCGEIATYPTGLGLLAGITFEQGGSVTRHGADLALSTANGLSPDALIIGGSFTSSEQYSTRGIFAGAGGTTTVYLQTDDGPMVRTTSAAAAGASSLSQIFAADQFLRIVDDEGRESYGVITAFSNPGGTAPQVVLSGSPAVPSKATYGVCGYAGMGVGALVNPVSRVLYDLRAIDPTVYTQYAGMFKTAGHDASGSHVGVAEAARTELVRVQLAADDSEIASTLEVVAEYAVDFKLGMTRAVAATSPIQLQRNPVGVAAAYTTTGAIDDATMRPEEVRSVQVRLITRAAERDRDVTIPPPSAGGILRFSLGTNLGHVRVRSAVTDVALPNQGAVTW